jgi:3-oxoacyl-[acyl-carrier protein] reductase
MVQFVTTDDTSTIQDWSQAMARLLTTPWDLFNAQYRAGLSMMESVMHAPVRGRRGGNARAPVTEPVATPVAAPVAAPRTVGEREQATPIKNKVAVVTGAASGIGEALVRELAAREAAAVVLVDRSDRIVELARAINESAGRAVAEARVGDTTDEAFRVGVFDEIVARHGVVNICVPAAGITRDSLAVKVDKVSGKTTVYPMETFRQVLEVNLLAPVYWAVEMVARIAEDRMKRGLGRWEPQETVQGTVVLIGSVSSQGNKGQIAYATAKAGLEGAAATLTKEAIYHGVRCAVIHPGFTDTPMVRALGKEYIDKNVLPYTQLRRLIRPQEIAEAICFLIANAAVSGELWADAGWHPSA